MAVIVFAPTASGTLSASQVALPVTKAGTPLTVMLLRLASVKEPRTLMRVVAKVELLAGAEIEITGGTESR